MWKRVACVLVALAATSFAQTTRTRSEVSLDGIVAVVDESVILRSDLDARVAGASGAIQTIADPAERERRIGKLVASTLEMMVDDELMVDAAIAAKLDVSDADIDAAIEEIKHEDAIDDEILAAALEAQGYSLASYRKELRRSLMRQRAIDQFVAPRVHVSGEIESAAPSTVAKPDLRSASAQRKTAAALTARAHAGAFPTVMLDVSVTDAGGKGVAGLVEADFTVTEDGKPQAISVSRDTVPDGIRVLVLYDTSGSITKSWGSAAKRAAFEAQLAKQLVDANSRNPFLLQVVGLSDLSNKTAWAAPDADQIKTRLAGIGSLSDVWWALGERATKAGASAVIVVSDFASSLEDTAKIPTYQRDLKASGVPLVIFPIGQVDRKATQLIHELSGCEEIEQNDPAAAEKLARFVETQVKQTAATNYVLEYRAPEQGAAKRTVEVAVKDAPAHPVTAEYTVPAVADRAAPAGIAGVYLTIDIAGRTATRTLAGLPLSYRGTIADTADARAIEDATRALNGLHTIAFEPAQPTTSAILHDGLTGMLTLQPIFAAGKRPASEMLPQLQKVQRFEPTAFLLYAGQVAAGNVDGALARGLIGVILAILSVGAAACT